MMSALQTEIERCNLWIEELAIPDRWKRPEVFFEAVDPQISDSPYVIGFATEESGGKYACGSALVNNNKDIWRAAFEMIERIAVVDAKSQGLLPNSNTTDWQYSLSNGVAAHTDAAHARRSARLELIERDALLRSWYGYASAPKKISQDIKVPEFFTKYYAFDAYTFETSDHLGEVSVCAVVAWPKDHAHLLAYGFGCAETLTLSLEKARNECLQRTAFLWGQGPAEELLFSPTAEYHQEIYLRAGAELKIKNWLNGIHEGSEPLKGPVPVIEFTDITPAFVKDKLFVVKADSVDLMRLMFGLAPYRCNLKKDIDPIHPIV